MQLGSELICQVHVDKNSILSWGESRVAYISNTMLVIRFTTMNVFPLGAVNIHK